MGLAIEGGKPVRENLLPYGKQWIDEEDIEAVVQVLRGDMVTQGPAIEKFEETVATYVGAKYAVAFSSGTAALHGACYAAGIGPGDEVITSPITFVASSNCVLYQKGTPVFADIKADTYNLDPEDAERKITDRTKAIIPVDFSGQPVEIDRFMELAEKHNLIIIEDAAHSLGATYKCRKVGNQAHMTMFSFHPVKHVTTGEGGVIVTNHEGYYKKLLMFRTHGITKNIAELEKYEGAWYHEMQLLGYHYRMTDIQASLGISQMRKIDRFVERRRYIAKRYTEAFRTCVGITVPHQHEHADSSWHLYVLRFHLSHFRIGRREIFDALRAENIGVNVHYIPVYHQPYYRDLGYDSVYCKNSEKYYEEAITLPLFPLMTDQDIEHVISAVKKVIEFKSLTPAY